MHTKNDSNPTYKLYFQLYFVTLNIFLFIYIYILPTIRKYFFLLNIVVTIV